MKNREDSTLTTTEFCQRYGIPATRVRDYKRTLVKLAHPTFRKYQRGQVLSKAHQDLLLYYRKAVNRGLRGDSLKRSLLSYSNCYRVQRAKLALVCKEQGLSDQQRSAIESALVEILREQATLKALGNDC